MKKEIVKHTESAMMKLTPETVKAYVNQYATDQEIVLFLNQCAMFGLNPFKREIYLIKYSKDQPATFVVGYEVYLKRAERSLKWAGMESGTEGDGENLKAWVKVYRKDWDKPIYHEVDFSEYAQYKDEWIEGKKTGKKILTRFWDEKPRTMLKKVAISQAFRMAFPDEFAGMPYTSEEMPVNYEKLPTTEIKTESIPNPTDIREGQEVSEPPGQNNAGTSPKATAKQIEFFGKLYEGMKKHGYDDAILREEIRKAFETKYEAKLPANIPADLTVKQASEIIDHLKSWLDEIGRAAKKQT